MTMSRVKRGMGEPGNNRKKMKRKRRGDEGKDLTPPTEWEENVWGPCYQTIEGYVSCPSSRTVIRREGQNVGKKSSAI